MAKTRGVENPIAEDAALIGDTRHELHHKSLPKRGHDGGYQTSRQGIPGDETRDDQGRGQQMSSDC